MQAARQLGQELARQGIGLVYGGGDRGLMGEVASAVLAGGGQVVGIIPQALEKFVSQPEGAEVHVVESMHERKAMMFNHADAFIALPGGIGTLEELCEILTWAQLSFHTKACGLLNVCHFYDKLLGFLDHLVDEHFVKPQHRRMLLVDQTPAGLLRQLHEYTPPEADKWVDPEA
jgi:uncharacterized protein (TIGR00730 family)